METKIQSRDPECKFDIVYGMAIIAVKISNPEIHEVRR